MVLHRDCFFGVLEAFANMAYRKSGGACIEEDRQLLLKGNVLRIMEPLVSEFIEEGFEHVLLHT